MQKFPITQKGLENIKEDLRKLKFEERPEVIKAISDARDQGDLSENAEYHAAREKQGFIEAKIKDLEDKISRAELVPINPDSDRVLFGATVYLLDQDSSQKKRYTIVGEYESDISKGLISTISPLGRALISKKVGDIIEVITPKNVLEYEVLKIEYNDIEI